MPFGFELAIILAMLALNAVFAAYEMALASVSRSRLTLLFEEKEKGAEAAIYMKEHTEASLAVIQLGITFVGSIAAATGGAGIEESLAPFLEYRLGFPEKWAEIFSLVCLIVPLGCLTIIFGELIPKVFALQNRERVCLALSPIMKKLSRAAHPAVMLFERIVKRVVGYGSRKLDPGHPGEQGLHELQAAVSLARASKVIGVQEEKIVLSASRLSGRPVCSAMIPAADMVMIPAGSSLEEAVVKVHMDLHTRFPVCEKENDPQSIIGYVNIKDIFFALQANPSDPSIRGIARALRSFDMGTPLSLVLGWMMQEKAHIALVCSKGKKVEGLVTLEDILEELVGEIEDEFDRMPSHIRSWGGGWVMGGGVAMQTVAGRTGVSVTEPGAAGQPLHEWCRKKIGRVPRGGDVIEDGGLRVCVRKIRRKKVAEAIVTVLGQPRH